MNVSQAAAGFGDLFAQVLDPAHRANPYPLYTRLRERPVTLQDDGTYVVSTYSAITRLLHDPRISSDERKSARGAGALAASGRLAPPGEPGSPPFIFLDPPEHDRLRRLVMQQFTPDRVRGMHRRIGELVDGLLDAQADRGELDVVDDLAYPLPVTVICELLGVPREDEPRFHGWASALARSLDPAERIPEPEIHAAGQAALQLLGYLGQLVEIRRTRPGDDLLSALVTGADPNDQLTPRELLATTALLLIAGHETTVNLVSNGMLALLRHPDVFDRLRSDPELVVPLVEEVLRYDPPVQFRTRTTLTDIELAGTDHPEGGDRGPAARLRQPRPDPLPGRRVLRARPHRQRPPRLRRRRPLLRRCTARPRRGPHRPRRARPQARRPPTARRPAPLPRQRLSARTSPPERRVRRHALNPGCPRESVHPP